jgi:hypothetical protein
MAPTDPNPGRRKLEKRLFAAGVAVWLAAGCVGFWFLWNYKMTPGPVESTPTVWPAGSAIQRQAGVPTVAMFAHPLCPCTRASIAELGDLVQRAGPVTVHLVMLRPDGAGPEWNDGVLTAAASIPGLSRVEDRNGVEARRFGAHTSGHVVIYGASGELIFSGGITGSRGHVGDNTSLARALSALAGRPGGAPETCPVYGCCLREPQ